MDDFSIIIAGPLITIALMVYCMSSWYMWRMDIWQFLGTLVFIISPLLISILALMIYWNRQEKKEKMKKIVEAI